jgi:hypothetical protein
VEELATVQLSGRSLHCERYYLQTKAGPKAQGSHLACIRAIKTFIEAHRSSSAPFDLAASGHSPGDDPAKALAHVEPYSEAGVTWWIEFVLPDPGEGDLAFMRIKQGPPK